LRLAEGSVGPGAHFGLPACVVRSRDARARARGARPLPRARRRGAPTGPRRGRRDGAAAGATVYGRRAPAAAHPPGADRPAASPAGLGARGVGRNGRGREREGFNASFGEASPYAVAVLAVLLCPPASPRSPPGGRRTPSPRAQRGAGSVERFASIAFAFVGWPRQTACRQQRQKVVPAFSVPLHLGWLAVREAVVSRHNAHRRRAVELR